MDAKIFFLGLRGRIAILRQSQIAGVNDILAGWAKFDPKADRRFIAYSLATAYHETARTMQPIEEYGHGRGRAYGAPAGSWHEIYDGRGDVQLTWLANYIKATTRLHLAKLLDPALDLAKTPALALKPEIAAAIMILGMTEGWFTGKKLSDYFNAKGSNPIEARRIINGLDCAQEIAVYYAAFESALKAAGAGTTS